MTTTLDENINLSIKEEQQYIHLSDINKNNKLSSATFFLDTSNIELVSDFPNNYKRRNVNFLDHILSEPSDSSVSDYDYDDYKKRTITRDNHYQKKISNHRN